MVLRFPVEIIGVERIGEELLQLSVRALSKFPPVLPGQFFHLAVDEFDGRGFWPDSRAFSIFSSDTVGKYVFLISRSGNFVERLWAQAVPGNQLWLKGPYGELNLDLQDIPLNSDVVFVAAGSGISPFPSLLESFLGRRSEGSTQATLLFSARTPQLLVGKEKFMKFTRRYPARFSVRYFITRGFGPVEDQELEFRRINAKDVLDSTREHVTTDFFISGPRPLVKSLQQGLVEAGVIDERIHFDAWG